MVILAAARGAGRAARRWWTALVPAMALAAAAVVALVVWRGRTAEAPAREDAVGIKGLGEVVLGVVRERGGVIRQDVQTFVPGDRWKLVVTCRPAARASVEVEVTELATATIDRPLPPGAIACGNRVVLPGAFTLDRPPRASRVRADHGRRGRGHRVRDPHARVTPRAPE